MSNLKLDLKAFYYLPRIVRAFKLGDAAILKELIKILKENKVQVIKSNFFNPELTLKKGTYTKIKPNRADKADINKAILLNSKNPNYFINRGTIYYDLGMINSACEDWYKAISMDNEIIDYSIIQINCN